MMKTLTKINRDKLFQVLNYNAETGAFTWNFQKGQRGKIGSLAGSDDGQGYLRIQIDGKKYKAHRLAWFYVHGEWPENVDHINGKKDDNRLCNLRSVSHAENHQNRRTPNKMAKVGLLGVDIKKGKFRARITKNGRQHDLGRFDTADLAHLAYLNAKRDIHPFGTI